MNRKARVLNNGVRAGVLEEVDQGYSFSYEASYLANPASSALSLTMPKQVEAYTSEHLFPFFHGLLAEGVTRDLQCRILKIDENDHFGRLQKTAHGDVIGNVTVEEIEEQ